MYDLEEAEFNAAMYEYYERKYDVKCAACGLEQTNSEAVLRECGWTLEKGLELCFQARCIRDREYKQWREHVTRLGETQEYRDWQAQAMAGGAA